MEDIKDGSTAECTDGLVTLRDQFALRAIAGLTANYHAHENSEQIASMAWEIADLAMKARMRPQVPA